MVKALARIFPWRKLLETGVYATIEEIAAAKKINSSYVGRLLRPTLPTPDDAGDVDGALCGSIGLGRTKPSCITVHASFCITLNSGNSVRCLFNRRVSSTLIVLPIGLPLIGGLLGHVLPTTTAKYAHLAADPTRNAGERIASRIASELTGHHGTVTRLVSAMRRQ